MSVAYLLRTVRYGEDVLNEFFVIDEFDAVITHVKKQIPFKDIWTRL